MAGLFFQTIAWNLQSCNQICTLLLTERLGRPWLRSAFEGLEPYDGNLSRTVLRGLGASNGPRLPGLWAMFDIISSIIIYRHLFDKRKDIIISIIVATSRFHRRIGYFPNSSAIEIILFTKVKFVDSSCSSSSNQMLSSIPTLSTTPRSKCRNVHPKLCGLPTPPTDQIDSFAVRFTINPR